MLTPAELDAHVDGLDLAGVAEWLVHGDPATIAEARKLYRSWRGAFRRRYGTRGPQIEQLGWTDRAWFLGAVAAGLASPELAASDMPWADARRTRDEQSDQLVRVASARDRAWVASYVAAIAEDAPGREWRRWGGPTRFEVMERLVAEHDLPTPTGPAFSVGWLWQWSWPLSRDASSETFADAVSAIAEDARMPGVLYRAVHTGWLTEVPRLPDALTELMRLDAVNRDAMVTHCVDALLEDQRPHSQRVLAGVLEVLELRASDFPGGLALVQGLVATCHGSVGRLLLPYAVELARDEHDLVELCTTVFSRPEKQQRADLVKALDDDRLIDRVGRAAVLAGLACLDTVDDTALRQRAERLATRLGRGIEPARRTALGLWDLPLPTVEPFRTPRVQRWERVDHEVPTWSPTLIDTLVSEAAVSGVDAVRSWLLACVERPDGTHLPRVARTWAAEPSMQALRTETERLTSNSTGWSLRDLPLLVDAEALDRLGRSTRLLSTPEFDALL